MGGVSAAISIPPENIKYDYLSDQIIVGAKQVMIKCFVFIRLITGRLAGVL